MSFKTKPRKPTGFKKLIDQLATELDLEDCEKLRNFIRHAIQLILGDIQNTTSFKKMSFRLASSIRLGAEVLLDIVPKGSDAHSPEIVTIALADNKYRGLPNDFKGCQSIDEIPPLVPRRSIIIWEFKKYGYPRWTGINSLKYRRRQSGNPTDFDFEMKIPLTGL